MVKRMLPDPKLVMAEVVEVCRVLRWNCAHPPPWVPRTPALKEAQRIMDEYVATMQEEARQIAAGEREMPDV